MYLKNYEKIFTQESERYLKELDTFLMSVENDPANRTLWGEIHGKVHSIKGMARALSLETITDLSHAMEDWCKEYQRGTTAATSKAVRLLADGADLLKVLVAEKGEIGSHETQTRYHSLYGQLKGGPRAWNDKPPPEDTQRCFSNPEPIHHVRVDYSLIEKLLGLSQEILRSEETLPPLPYDQLPPRLKNWLIHYQSLLRTLSVQIAHLRLMSVADFADLFVKTVRDVAWGYNKEVRLRVIGGEVQADIALMDRLREPVMHLFRNAIAHGIEPPEERVRAGKTREGTITLEVHRQHDSLMITISDDGRGIDRSAIISYLRETGAMADGQIQAMSSDDFFNTILSPEFSSSPETTDMAGRGIGMSVVAQAIGYLGGSMVIRSESLKGTQFTIRLPLSLSVIHAVTFQIGPYSLSIPTSNVESISGRKQVSPKNRHASCDLRGLLGVNGGAEASYTLKLKYLTQTDTHTKRDGDSELVVDRIIGNRPLVVMPVGELLAQIGLFAGVGIMENGTISMLLDVERVLESGN